MQTVLVERAEILNQIADRDFDGYGVSNPALIEIRIAEGEIPLGVERVADGFQDCGLGRVTFPYEAENIGRWEVPFKLFHSTKVLDHYLSDFHRPSILLSIVYEGEQNPSVTPPPALPSKATNCG